jgi:hypothetical protein
MEGRRQSVAKEGVMRLRPLRFAPSAITRRSLRINGSEVVCAAAVGLAVTLPTIRLRNGPVLVPQGRAVECLYIVHTGAKEVDPKVVDEIVGFK